MVFTQFRRVRPTFSRYLLSSVNWVAFYHYQFDIFEWRKKWHTSKKIPAKFSQTAHPLDTQPKKTEIWTLKWLEIIVINNLTLGPWRSRKKTDLLLVFGGRRARRFRFFDAHRDLGTVRRRTRRRRGSRRRRRRRCRRRRRQQGHRRRRRRVEQQRVDGRRLLPALVVDVVAHRQRQRWRRALADALAHRQDHVRAALGRLLVAASTNVSNRVTHTVPQSIPRIQHSQHQRFTPTWTTIWSDSPILVITHPNVTHTVVTCKSGSGVENGSFPCVCAARRRWMNGRSPSAPERRSSLLQWISEAFPLGCYLILNGSCVKRVFETLISFIKIRRCYSFHNLWTNISLSFIDSRS